MPDTHTTFANIVATPRRDTWSQAYNAGKLFAVISLAHTKSEEAEPHALALLGKEIVNALEEEYFTLEVKNLTTIKEALTATLKKVPPHIIFSASVGVINENVFYVLSVNGGTTILKRGDHIGIVMTSKHYRETADQSEQTAIHAASGFLKNGDIIVLQTYAFHKLLPLESLARELDQGTPADSAEKLSPKVHETEEGGATAIILSFHEAATATAESETDDSETEADTLEKNPEQKEAIPYQPRASLHTSPKHSPLTAVQAFFSHAKLPPLPKLRVVSGASHKKKLFFSIAIILIVLFGLSIYFATQKQQEAKTQQLFQDIYPKAQRKYDEATALVSLNKSLASDDFKEAQKILKDNESSFPKDSKEYQQIQTLLSQIDSQLGGSTQSTQTPTAEAGNGESPLLEAIRKTKALYGIQSGNTIYIADQNGVSTLDGDKTTSTVKNNNFWKSVGGIGVFGTNIYVLDKKTDQIIKFTGGSESNKANYFADNAPSLSHATDMAIDASIYISFDDGSIKKYTRGKEDDFSLTSLTTPLKNPIRMVTNEDIDSLYVLDPGSARIVVLDKSGGFKKDYSSTLLQKATAIDVSEKDKKVFFLSGGKIYTIPLE